MPVQKEFVTLRLEDIKPYENNPRINDDAVDDVAASIEQCENLDPIEIDENNVILSGHTRLKALKKLGYTETECLRYTGLTDKQKRKYRLLTNKTGEKALWDIELLPMELDDLDFDGYDFDFDVFDMNSIEEVDAFDEDDDDKEFFNATFVFPTAKKKEILSYLRKHKEEITDEIIRKAGE